MTYSVHLTPEAERGIEDQARYIAHEQHDPCGAAQWLGRVVKAIDTLDQSPRRCPRVPENDARSYDIHGLRIDGFVALFTVDDAKRAVYVFATRPRGMSIQLGRLPSARQAIASKAKQGTKRPGLDPEAVRRAAERVQAREASRRGPTHDQGRSR